MAIENLITDHLDLWTAAVRPKSSAGRGNNSKLELTGIKKLRELILELAVRGKLVPQDPSDEPASVLLERIAAEKTRLVKEEGLRTSANEVVDIADEYIECPSHWKWARLGNIAKFIDYRGKTPNKIDAGVRLITAKNIRYGYIDLVPEEFISEADYEQWMTRGFPRVGDTLFTTEAPLGNAAVIDINERFALAQRAICFQWHYSTVSRFMLIQILASPFQNQLLDNSSGMTATGVKASRLKEIPVVIPPAEEQQRIVAKVDELMALCDQLELRSESQLAAHQTLVEALLATLTDSTDADELAQNWARLSTHFDTLFTTEASIEALKQTILQLAVMGKLVPQDPSDEPASVLLERISAEKAQLVREGKIKSEKQYPVISDAELPHSKPDGWVFERFGNVLINRDFERIPLAVSEREKRKGGYDYYGASGVIDKIDGYLFDKPLLLIGEDGANLINRSSPIAFIARGKYWVNNHAHVLDGLNEELLKYVCLHINAISLLPYITGTAQPKMNQAKMNAIVLGIPPLAEQKRIVAKVDELMALCDQLKSRLQTSQQTQLALAESLVEGALA